MSNLPRARRPIAPADASIIKAAALAIAFAAGPVWASPTASPLPPMPATATTTITHHSASASTPSASASGQPGSYNWAAPPPVLPTKVIYNGQTAAQSGISIDSWGGGSGSITSEIFYTRAGNSIKIDTHGLYEGARINFKPAVALGDPAEAKNRTLQLLVRFGSSDDNGDEDTGDAANAASAPRRYARSTTLTFAATADYKPVSTDWAGLLRLAQGPPPGFRPGYPGGAYPGGAYPGGAYPGGAYPRGGYPGVGGRGGYPGGVPPPGGYRGYPGQNAPQGEYAGPTQEWNPPIHYFRLLFTLQDGAQAEIMRPTPWPNAFDDPDTAWLSIGVPLSRLDFGAGHENSPLASITIGGDGPAVFYIGQINLVDDTAPIICSAGPTQDVAAGDDVTFQARAQGGASMLQYSWNFDSTDGMGDEADGITVTHKYLKGDKDYTATLTVTDLDGIKKPCTSTVKIKVEE